MATKNETATIKTSDITVTAAEQAVMSVQENPQLTQQRDLKAREFGKQQILKKLQNEKMVEVKGSPMYRPYFGNNMPIVIQGFPCYIPLDGRPYKVRESYAKIFEERISRIDALIQQNGIMGNIIEDDGVAGSTDFIAEI